MRVLVRYWLKTLARVLKQVRSRILLVFAAATATDREQDYRDGLYCPDARQSAELTRRQTLNLLLAAYGHRGRLVQVSGEANGK